MDTLDSLRVDVEACRQCPRLVEWREQVAREKRAAFRGDVYWGRPVPGFGDPTARIVVIGLAPAAHGANRTGRVFTGDRSGDWLYRAMWRAGLANQAESVSLDDGLELTDAWVTAPVKCAPPANKPTPAERDSCHTFFERELALLTERKVFIVLGQFGFNALTSAFGIRPRPKFGHGAEIELGDGTTIIASYHVSQQNTFTGRLTESMLDDVFTRAVALAGGPSADGGQAD